MDTTAPPVARAAAPPPATRSAVAEGGSPTALDPGPERILLPALGQRIAACQAASTLAKTLGDELAGYAPRVHGMNALPEVLGQLCPRPLAPTDPVAVIDRGPGVQRLGWTAEGVAIGALEAVESAACAAALSDATLAMSQLAAQIGANAAVAHAEPDPSLRMLLVSACYGACDRLEPGWGRWVAAVCGAQLVSTFWDQFAGRMRREACMLLWQCAFDARDAGQALVAAVPVPAEAPVVHPALAATRYAAAWAELATQVSDLGCRASAAALASAQRRDPGLRGPGPASGPLDAS